MAGWDGFVRFLVVVDVYVGVDFVVVVQLSTRPPLLLLSMVDVLLFSNVLDYILGR